jgi:hypothetical protein
MSHVLELRVDNKKYWKIQNLDIEFVKGFVFCFYLFYQNFEQNIKLILYENSIKKFKFNSDKEYEQFLLPVILYRDIQDENKKMYKSSSSCFTWWIDDILIVFKTEKFLQGLITCFNYFYLDFRNYTYGLPFKYENNLIHYYLIQDFDLENKNN